MKVTVNGFRLTQDWKTGVVSQGAKPTVKVPLSPRPRVVWNGNPYCEPGCVLYLPGLPGTGTKVFDYSGQGNHGTLAAGATWVRLPSGLWCLIFDGTDDVVTIADANSLDLTTALTIEAWVKILSWDVNNYEAILNKRSGTTMNYFFGIRSKYLDFYFHDGTAYRGFTDDTTLLALNTWYHLLVVCDTVTDLVNLYVNGKLAKTFANTWALVANDIIVYIGRDGAAGSNYANFQLALIRIHNRAFSALDDQNHFNQERHLLRV